MPGLVPTPMPAPMPTSVPAPVFRLGSPAVLFSRCIPAPAASAVLFSLSSAPGFYSRSSALLSSRLMPAPVISCYRILAFLLLFPVLGPPLSLKSSPLRTFKQTLSDKPLPCTSTSCAKPLRMFLALSLYNPTNNNKGKRNFDTALINSYLLASNHNQKKVRLSFAGYRCPNTVKWNRLLQLDLLNPKPVCIIKAISLTAALF